MESLKDIKLDNATLKSFGIVFSVVIAILCLIGDYIFNLNLSKYLYLLPIVIIFFAHFYPVLLKIIYIPLTILGFYVGKLNSLLLLSATLYIVMTPISLVMKLFKKDSMEKTFDRNVESYRKVVTHKIDMEKMF